MFWLKYFLSSSQAMYDEICQFRKACGDAHMKTILAVGELATFTTVYKASLVAMMAGQSIIRTEIFLELFSINIFT